MCQILISGTSTPEVGLSSCGLPAGQHFPARRPGPDSRVALFLRIGRTGIVSYAVRTRVYVADDHPMFLEALVDAIRERPDMELVGAGTSGPEALAGIRALAPDVAVLDMRLPEMSGQQVLELATRGGTDARFVFLTAHVASDLVYAALAAGAAGYLSKAIDREA